MVSVIALSICLVVFLLPSGCGEDPDAVQPVQKQVVVQRIIKPAPQKKKEPVTIRAAKVEVRDQGHQELNPPKALSPGFPSSPPSTQEKGPLKPATFGGYRVKKGDTLALIAKNVEPYGHPMKWTFLFMNNREALDSVEVTDDFQDRALPSGIQLRIITRDEIKTHLRDRAHRVWVVNVLSSTEREEVVIPAVRLIRKGYQAYITTANVKGKEWMRLRVGFYGSREEAYGEGEKMMAFLGLKDSWTTKIGPEEFSHYAGY